MLIATITALAILFGGGTFETFFVDDLKKGVKEYVVEDQRKDEILDDLKRSKKMIKSFNKERKAQFKEFKKLNSSRATGSDELTGFFEKSMTTRGEYQHRLIEERLKVSAKITPDEWAAIIENSGHATDKRMQKAQKKLDKAEARGKLPFDKTRETITEAVADTDTQQLLQGRLDAMLRSIRYAVCGDVPCKAPCPCAMPCALRSTACDVVCGAVCDAVFGVRPRVKPYGAVSCVMPYAERRGVRHVTTVCGVACERHCACCPRRSFSRPFNPENRQ